MRLLIIIEYPVSQVNLLSKLVNPTGTLVKIENNRVILDSSDLVHSSLDELDTSKIDDVWKRVRQFISEINGAAAIMLPSLPPLGLVNIQVVKPGGESTWLPITASVEIYNEMQTVTATMSTDATSDITHVSARTVRRHPAAELLIVALHDHNVAKVLRLQEHKKDWTNLYRIFEIIKDDIGGKEIISRKWAKVDEIKAFTGSANNPNVSGDDSRHGPLKGERPKKTMGITEARFLIAGITRKWLRHKMREKPT